MESGERIQKVFTTKGILSRRKTEEAIRDGRIQVNGRPAKIGHQINTRTDVVTLDGKRVQLGERIPRIYLMLHKPRGFMTTTQDQHGRRTVMDLVSKIPHRIYPMGRLDLESEGLILMTNDGQLANDIMHPSSQVSKTYRVTIRGDVREEQLIELSTGIVLDDGYRTMPAQIHVIEKTPGRTVIQFTVTEGRNRLIRRMCEAAGLELIRLKRTHIGPIKLGMLSPGDYRELSPSELEALRNSVRKAKNKGESQGGR